MMSACMCITSCGGDDPRPTEPPGSEVPTEPSEPKRENILAFDIVDGEAEVRCVSDTVTEVKIPSEVTIDGATYPVTTIAKEAFKNLTSLKTLHMPSSIDKISYAFEGTDIDSLYIESLESWCKIDFGYEFKNYYETFENDYIRWHNPLRRNTAFIVNGKLVTDLLIPEKVTEIPYGAFYGLNCRSVTFPEVLESISADSFGECDNLTEVKFPDSLREIGSGAFGYCKNLSKIDLGNGVNSIFVYAFNGCEKLETVTLPESLTYVGVNSFDVNTKKFNINNTDWWCRLKRPQWYEFHGGAPSSGFYPDSEEEHPHSLYIDGKVVTDIVIPGSLSKITADTFHGNTALRRVSIEEGITEIEKNAFRDCPELRDVTLPSTLKSIGLQAFQKCGIEVLYIPPCSLDSIANWAFYECHGLRSIEICEPVKYIGMLAFGDCESLATVRLPETLVEFGIFPFFVSDSIREIYVKAQNPPLLESGFGNSTSTNITIYIPTGTLEAYKNSVGWKGYEYKETDF